MYNERKMISFLVIEFDKNGHYSETITVKETKFTGMAHE
jgi:hypothetical protein